MSLKEIVDQALCLNETSSNSPGGGAESTPNENGENHSQTNDMNTLLLGSRFVNLHHPALYGESSFSRNMIRQLARTPCVYTFPYPYRFANHPCMPNREDSPEGQNGQTVVSSHRAGSPTSSHPPCHCIDHMKTLVYHGVLKFSNNNVLVRIYCLRGNPRFATRFMGSIEMIPIRKRRQMPVDSTLFWDTFRDPQYTILVGLSQNREDEEIFIQSFGGPNTCFYDVFSIQRLWQQRRFSLYIHRITSFSLAFLKSITPASEDLDLTQIFMIIVIGQA